MSEKGLDLSSTDGIIHWLTACARGVMRGEVSSREANSIAYLANAALRTIETSKATDKAKALLIRLQTKHQIGDGASASKTEELRLEGFSESEAAELVTRLKRNAQEGQKSSAMSRLEGAIAEAHDRAVVDKQTRQDDRGEIHVSQPGNALPEEPPPGRGSLPVSGSGDSSPEAAERGGRGPEGAPAASEPEAPPEEGGTETEVVDYEGDELED
jgi:hypothetical protein